MCHAVWLRLRNYHRNLQRKVGALYCQEHCNQLQCKLCSYLAPGHRYINAQLVVPGGLPGTQQLPEPWLITALAQSGCQQQPLCRARSRLQEADCLLGGTVRLSAYVTKSNVLGSCAG